MKTFVNNLFPNILYSLNKCFMIGGSLAANNAT